MLSSSIVSRVMRTASARRIHHGAAQNYSGVITLAVFLFFSVLYLAEKLKGHYCRQVLAASPGGILCIHKW